MATSQQIEDRLDRHVAGEIALQHAPGNLATIAPRDLSELMEFSKLMAISGECIPPVFRNKPGACLAIALQAFRTGADPFAVANKAFLVNERIAYESQYLHSLLNTSGLLSKRLRPEYSGEGATRRCKVVGSIRGEEQPFEYESPRLGDIPKNSPLWKSDPDQQLFYYSSRAFARRYAPEVLLGMYTPEELLEPPIRDITPPPRPTREQYHGAVDDTSPAPLAEAATSRPNDPPAPTGQNGDRGRERYFFRSPVVKDDAPTEPEFDRAEDAVEAAIAAIGEAARERLPREEVQEAFSPLYDRLIAEPETEHWRLAKTLQIHFDACFPLSPDESGDYQRLNATPSPAPPDESGDEDDHVEEPEPNGAGFIEYADRVVREAAAKARSVREFERWWVQKCPVDVRNALRGRTNEYRELVGGSQPK